MRRLVPQRNSGPGQSCSRLYLQSLWLPFMVPWGPRTGGWVRCGAINTKSAFPLAATAGSPKPCRPGIFTVSILARTFVIAPGRPLLRNGLYGFVCDGRRAWLYSPWAPPARRVVAASLVHGTFCWLPVISTGGHPITRLQDVQLGAAGIPRMQAEIITPASPTGGASHAIAGYFEILGSQMMCARSTPRPDAYQSHLLHPAIIFWSIDPRTDEHVAHQP